MKKFIAILLVLTVALSLAACGGNVASETTAAPVETTEVPVETTEAPVETTAAPADEVAVMTYDEYIAAELDTEVTVECYVQATQSWWSDAITVYAQDENGAYFLYNLACSEEDAAKLVPGTKIRVNGFKGEWAGEVEIMDGTFEFVEGETWTAEALDVTELLGTDELIAHQNELVSFTGLTVEASNDDGAAFLYNWDGSGQEGTDSDLYFKASLNGETYTFVIEYYLCDETTEAYQAVQNLQVGDVINLEGFLYWYDGVQPHITSVAVAE